MTIELTDIKSAMGECNGAVETVQRLAPQRRCRECGRQEVGLMPGHPRKTLGEQIDAPSDTRIADAREDLPVYLTDAMAYVALSALSLERAHREACIADPVAALVILPMLGTAHKLEQQIAELIGVRGEK